MPDDELPPFLRPLAETCGLPATPTYGSRYDATYRNYFENRHRWLCRSCGETVTDRYTHELDHRKNSWIREIDALYETVHILFGGES